MATITSNGTGGGLAGMGSSWAGGIAPIEGDKVIIAAGDTITLDGAYTWGDDNNTATIGTAAVSVSGTLKASRTVSSSLTVKGLLLTNQATHSLDYGTDASPIPYGVNAVLILNKATTPAARNGLQQLTPTGGVGNYVLWTFVGDDSRERGVNLDANTSTSSADIVLKSSAHGWQVGDELLFFTTTDNTTADQCETRTISNIAGATITLNSAPTYVHKAGSPVCNMTCNVLVRSYNEVSGQMANPSMIMPGYLSPYATAGYRYILKNTRFQSLGSTGVNSGVCNGSGTGGLPAASEWTFYKCVVKNLVTNASILSGAYAVRATLTECVAYMNGAPAYQSSPNISGSWIAAGQAFMSYSSIAYAKLTDTWVTGRGSGFQMALPHGAICDNVTVSGTGVNLAAFAVDVEFKNCDLGYTYGWETYYSGDYMFRMVTTDINGKVTFKDCLLDSEVEIPSLPAAMANQSEDLTVPYINKGRDVTAQEIYYAAGTIKRDNSTKYRSTSAFALTFNKTGANVVRRQDIACANGRGIRIIGYCRFDSSFYNSNDYTAPTVTITGLGITPVTYTATSTANGAWEKFDLTATNNVAGYDGNFTLTYTANAKTVTTGTVYFDGVTDAPFVTLARHYGFTFDEANPTRKVNATISANEAAAGGYTGITVTGATSAIALGSDHTFQELYDYTQAWACTTANLGYAVPLTGVGIAGSSSLFAVGNITTTGYTLNGSGSISMGSQTLTATDYTYTGGTFSQASTVPSFAGGVLSLPTAGSYSYGFVGTEIEFGAAATTWNLSDSTFSGATHFSTSTGSLAVTVAVPAGLSYTTEGANITVTEPIQSAPIAWAGALDATTVLLYNDSNAGAIIDTQTVSGAGGYVRSITLPHADVAVGDSLRLRFGNKEYYAGELRGTMTATGLTFVGSMAPHPVYAGWALDGAAYDQANGGPFTMDGPNLQIDISTAGTTTGLKTHLGAWTQYLMTLPAGLDAFYGGWDLLAVNQIRQNVGTVDVLIDVVTAGALFVFTDHDVNYYRSDFSFPGLVQAGHGLPAMTYNASIFVPDPVVISGESVVTGTAAEIIAAIPSAATIANEVVNVTIVP